VEFFGYSLRDLNRKIQGTVFLLNGEPWQFRQILDRSDVDNASSTVQAYVVGRDGTWELTTSGYPVMGEIEWYQPDLGYVNYNRCAHYLMRTVSRQYMLGFNLNNYVLGKAFDHERMNLSGGRLHLRDGVNSPLFIQKVVNRAYFTTEQALNFIEDGSVLSVAISPEIAFSQSVNFDHPVICYKDKVVGYVDKDTGEKFLFSPAEYVATILPFQVTIKEEMNDLISRY
jgi:hypothetical protein